MNTKAYSAIPEEKEILLIDGVAVGVMNIVDEQFEYKGKKHIVTVIELRHKGN